MSDSLIDTSVSVAATARTSVTLDRRGFADLSRVRIA